MFVQCNYYVYKYTHIHVPRQHFRTFGCRQHKHALFWWWTLCNVYFMCKIPRPLQCIQGIHFNQHVCSLGNKPMTFCAVLYKLQNTILSWRVTVFTNHYFLKVLPFKYLCPSHACVQKVHLITSPIIRDGLMHRPTVHLPRALDQQGALANILCVHFFIF